MMTAQTALLKSMVLKSDPWTKGIGLSWNLLEKQILMSHPHSTESETEF